MSITITNSKVNYGPSIVTDGLVLYLDAANPNSYPGSGDYWYDLSGYNNHGTLVNFTGSGAGSTSGFDTNTSYMMFDRHVGTSDFDVNNYVSITNSDSLDDVLCQNGMTIDMWFKETSTVCTAFTKWNGSWELYYCSTMTFRTQGTGGSDGSTSASSSPGNWRHIIATHDGTNRIMYANIESVLNDTNVVTGQNTTSNVSIGAYHGGSYASIGAIPIYRLYNRALTQSEITQNYNAQKSRFGL